MKNSNHSILTALFLVLALLLPSISVVYAQRDEDDLVGGASSDISGGSSVFVFKGRKKPQQRNAFRAVQVVRTPQARFQARRERIEQSKTVARVIPKPTPKPTPKPNNPEEVAKVEGAARLVRGANEYLKQNNLEEAENGFFEATTLDSKNDEAKIGMSAVYAARGDISYEKQDYDRAVLLYQKALTFDDTNANTYASLGDAYDSLKQSDQALKAYQTAYKLNNKLTALIAPLGILSAATGNYSESANYLKQALATAPDDIKSRDAYGLVLSKLERNEEAKNALLKAVELNATNADSYYYLGGAYDRLGDTEKAIDAYQKAIALNPKYKEAFFDLATIYYNRGKYKEAAENYDQAVRQQGNYVEARLNLADSYRQLGDDGDKAAYSIAVDKYRSVVSLLEQQPAAPTAGAADGSGAPTAFKPNLADVYYKFSYCLGRNKQWQSAIDYMKKSVALQPDAVNYTNLAWAYNGNKDYQNAVAAAQEGVRLNSSFPAAYLNLGNAQANSSQYPDAEKSFLQALKLKKDWALALNNLGYVYGKMSDWKRAVDAHRQAVAAEPNNAGSHYNLGFTAVELGDKKTAERERDILLTLNPYLAKQLDGKIKNSSFGKDKKRN